MNPLFILVPAGVGIGLYFLLSGKSSSPAYTPPPGTPTAASGGTRYQNYMQQLQTASLVYSAASLFDKSSTSTAATQLKGTLDVVNGMAVADLAAKNITQPDLTNIQNQIAALRRQIA